MCKFLLNLRQSWGDAMNWVRNLTLAAMVATGLLASAIAAPVRPQPLKIGIVRGLLHDLPPALTKMLAVHFELIVKAQTGLAGELLPVDSADELRAKLADNSHQMAVLHGFEFGWMRQKLADLAPLMVNAKDPGALQALVVVPRDCAAATVGECRGRSLTLPRDTRADFRLFLTRRCVEGEAAVFQEGQPAASVEDALDDVVDGLAGATVVDVRGWDVYEKRKPGRAGRLRVVARSEPFPTSVIAYRKGQIDDGTVTRFRDGMAAAHTTVMGRRLMGLMGMKQFEPATAEYEKQLAETLRLYPPLD